MSWRSRNYGLHFQDPAYDDTYDEDEDYDAYENECELREDMRRERDD